MRIFGVIPFRNTEDPANDYIKAGYDSSIVPVVKQRIIQTQNLEVSQQRRFENVFRIIASNRIGRLLLYRILIEIRRLNAVGGVCEQGVRQQLLDRNFNRCVTIERKNSLSICFGHRARQNISASNAIIRFNDKIIPTNGVFIKSPTYNYHKVERCYRPAEVGLFHEMVHWFHMLRGPNRTIQESKAYMVAGGNLVVPPVNLLGSRRQETIGSYFWGNLKNNTDNNSIKVSGIPWVEDKEIDATSNRMAKVINFEDIRTILGAPDLREFRNVVPQLQHANQFQYWEGDDLSGNSFRVSLGMPIRLGHTTMDFYEDYEVVDRALKIAGGTPRNNLLNDQCGLGNLCIRNYNSYCFR